MSDMHLPPKWSAAEIALLESLAQQGWSAAVIGRRLHRSENGVRGKAGSLGIEIASSRGVRRVPLTFADAQKVAAWR
ncbi:hypothetical protein [Brevundimonas sp.]|jgi:hypothetical protein|uniref:hypothetical protein n=1 Tax=Brevundimonas sp. TaxID=1871086 RepID=UPI0037BF45B1